MRFLLVIGVLLSGAIPSLANDCRRRVVVVKHQAVAVVEKKLEAVVLAAVFVPVVSVGYTPPVVVSPPVPVSQPIAQSSIDMQSLLTEIRNLGQ